MWQVIKKTQTRHVAHLSATISELATFPHERDSKTHGRSGQVRRLVCQTQVLLLLYYCSLGTVAITTTVWILPFMGPFGRDEIPSGFVILKSKMLGILGKHHELRPKQHVGAHRTSSADVCGFCLWLCSLHSRLLSSPLSGSWISQFDFLLKKKVEPGFRADLISSGLEKMHKGDWLQFITCPVTFLPVNNLDLEKAFLGKFKIRGRNRA